MADSYIGKSDRDGSSKVDWLWYHYKDLGYVTMIGEEECGGKSSVDDVGSYSRHSMNFERFWSAAPT